MRKRYFQVSLILALLFTMIGGVFSTGYAKTTKSIVITFPSMAPVKETEKPSILARDHAQRFKQVPKVTISNKKTYIADVYTTAGTFSIELFNRIAPIATNNFVFLSNHHFYDGDLFFRTIKNYIVQTGDPLQNGTGGPGYTWPDELPPHYAYTAGIVAMANSGPNTNGSQFFIVTAHDAQVLNQNPYYTQFGRVIHGLSVVDKIANAPVTYNPMMNENSKPRKPIQIVRIVIRTLA